MRIFLTGATGYIGHAVLDVLVRGGHQVTALVRDANKAQRVNERGAQAVVGNLGEPQTFRVAAEAQDGYIHTAYDWTGGPAIERAALDAIVAAAARPRTGDSTRKRFVIYTSGIWILGPTSEPAAEDARVNPVELVAWRPEHERRILDAAGPGLRTIVVRPGIVYGGSQGIVSDLLKSASNGLVRVIGDGNNHWPLVYDRDLADLYGRLVADDAASGIYHANDEGTSESTTSCRRSRRICRSGPTCDTCRSTRRGARWGPSRTRWRSISS
jgi:nucleoside-diphosphate-sugar epimerase